MPSPACWLTDDVAASLADRVYVKVFSDAKCPLCVCVCLAGGSCVTWRIYEVAQGLSAFLGMTDVSGQGGRGREDRGGRGGL